MKLFAGHRGVGKTSELYRLTRMLETPDGDASPFRVFYMDDGRTLDVNDLDLLDLLVYIAGETQHQLGEAKIPGFDATTTLLSRLWGDLKTALNPEIAVPGGQVEVEGFGSLAVEFRNRPDARLELRKAVEQQSTNLLFAINDLLDKANAALVKAGYAGLVLIVEGLDRLIYRTLEDGQTTHDRLFIARASQLASLRTHIIYTVPISLIYSPQCAQLEESLGEHTAPEAMICVRPSDRGPVGMATQGMDKLREIVTKQCAYAGVNVKDVFEYEDSLNHLCEMISGHPRLLLMFIQSAINELDDLPITAAALARAIRKYANSLLRAVPDDFWPYLRQFDEPQADIPKGISEQLEQSKTTPPPSSPGPEKTKGYY